MLVGGGGNVGVFISNGEVILIDNNMKSSRMFLWLL